MITLKDGDLTPKFLQYAATIAELNKTHITSDDRYDVANDLTTAFIDNLVEYKSETSEIKKNLGYSIVHKKDHGRFYDNRVYTMLMNARDVLDSINIKDEYEIIRLNEMSVVID